MLGIIVFILVGGLTDHWALAGVLCVLIWIFAGRK